MLYILYYSNILLLYIKLKLTAWQQNPWQVILQTRGIILCKNYSNNSLFLWLCVYVYLPGLILIQKYIILNFPSVDFIFGTIKEHRNISNFSFFTLILYVPCLSKTLPYCWCFDDVLKYFQGNLHLFGLDFVVRPVYLSNLESTLLSR